MAIHPFKIRDKAEQVWGRHRTVGRNNTAGLASEGKSRLLLQIHLANGKGEVASIHHNKNNSMPPVEQELGK
jgi:hypothetical protein